VKDLHICWGHLPESRSVPELPRDTFEEIVVALPAWFGNSQLLGDHCHDALRSHDAHRPIQVVAPVQVGFDQHQLVGRELAQFGLDRFRSRLVSPTWRYGIEPAT
jgi:hypothetical protein